MGKSAKNRPVQLKTLKGWDSAIIEIPVDIASTRIVDTDVLKLVFVAVLKLADPSLISPDEAKELFSNAWQEWRQMAIEASGGDADRST